MKRVITASAAGTATHDVTITPSDATKRIVLYAINQAQSGTATASPGACHFKVTNVETDKESLVSAWYYTEPNSGVGVGLNWSCDPEIGDMKYILKGQATVITFRQQNMNAAGILNSCVEYEEV